MTLDWDVDSDEGFTFPKNSLPELRGISVDFHGNGELIKANIKALAHCEHLAHLRVRGCPHANYLQIAQLGESLKCLELDPRVYPWREGFEEPDEDNERLTAALKAETGMGNLSAIIGSMLGQLHVLQELAVDLETGSTYSRNDDGKFVNPDPMDLKDLVGRPRVSQ